ncbi:MAG: GNAT family N-acetyltransferase, partial [Chloroflexi bacterium]|nr:GNAT family N-acetyltransferase [Chloroflexota bacterium]
SRSGGRSGWACRRIDQPPLQRQSHGHSAGFGMGIHDDFQSQGIETRLMEAMLDLAENWLNIRRIALYKKFGFEIEGAHRDHAFREGQYVDSCTMARLKK